MNVKQIYELTNDIVKEVLGESVILNENLSNVVEVGGAITDKIGYDGYCKKITDKIGRTIFNDKKYQGVLASINKEAWDFGSMLEKVSVDLLEAQENESWSLTKNASYDTNVFKPVDAVCLYWNDKKTFEIQVSIVDEQLHSCFKSANELNKFISLIYTQVENSMTLRIEELSRRAINNMIALTMYDEFPSGTYTGVSGTKAVNLLYLYNTEKGTSLTKDKCLKDTDFLKYASYTMGIYVDRLKSFSTLFNIAKKPRFVAKDELHFVVLSDYAKATASYLQADTYHKELVELPMYESIPYFQATGTGYAFADVSKIKVTSSDNHDVELSAVIGVMFSDSAVAISNESRRTTSSYNAKGEFTNNYFKYDFNVLNSKDEPFVVFYVA